MILLLVAVNGVFVMAEMAVISSRRPRLQQLANEGSDGAQIALELATNPDRFLATTQIGITLIAILAGAYGERTLTSRLSGFLESFPSVASYRESLAFGIVVVGITYSGDHPDYDSLRAMDYTPTPGGPKGSGDGAKFLNFLRTELIPFMETNYGGDPARRILGGHSLGGLFTLYAMFSDPSLFWGYLAGSPAIPWDNNFIVRQEEEFAKSHKDLPVRLYFAVGGAEPLVTPDVSFMQSLAARNYSGLHWDARVIEAERHSGVKPEFYNRGLRFLFGN